MRQYDNETNDDYLTRFKSMVETLILAGGEHILVSKELIGKDDLSLATKEELNEEKQKFMATCFILRSDETRYKKLLDDLKSSANRGRDEYPTTLTNAFDLLVRESGEYNTMRGSSSRFRPRRRRGGPRGGRGRNSFLFTQQGRGNRGNREERPTFSRTNGDNSEEIVAGTDGETHPRVTCFGCSFMGHYRDQCPYATRNDVQAMHVGCTLTQGTFFTIPKTWILLDTCSTCDVSNNTNMVHDIRPCSSENVLTAYTNGGAQRYESLADLRLLPITVHFKESSMATILSFKSVSEIPGAKITLDTDVNKDINLSLPDGRKFVFEQYKNGLYFLDTDKHVKTSKSKCALTNYSFLSTVSDNKDFFAARN
jgi:hypothetical protein